MSHGQSSTYGTGGVMRRGLVLRLPSWRRWHRRRHRRRNWPRPGGCYNEQRYADAIKMADEARQVAAIAAPASIVLSRAHLERYRPTSEVAGPRSRARGAEKRRRDQALPRDQVEFTDRARPSRSISTTSSRSTIATAPRPSSSRSRSARADLARYRSRDLLFEWWALSLDRQAQLGPERERRPAYERIVARAEREMARDVAAASASYWLAAGARGIDDLPRAWGAAVAGLGTRGVARARGEPPARRSRSTGDAGDSARARAADSPPAATPEPTLASLEAQWEEVKDRWK